MHSIRVVPYYLLNAIKDSGTFMAEQGVVKSEREPTNIGTEGSRSGGQSERTVAVLQSKVTGRRTGPREKFQYASQ